MTNVNRINSRKHRPTVVFVVLITFLAIIGFPVSCTRSDQQVASAPEKITIAYSASPDSALAQVAQVQGYYLQEGLDAIPQMYSYGKIALQAVIKGKADFATVAETPVMFAIMRGEKISIIATIVTSRKNNAIIARRDKGILAPRDLKGRKIAATFGTISEFFMDAFLVTQGISRKDMRVINLGPEEQQEAIARGDVDAISAFTPFTFEAQKQLGDAGITFHNEEIYTQTFNIVATQEYVRMNPRKVKKMLVALVKAEEFVRTHPADAKKIVADFSRLDNAIVNGVWADENFEVTLDQSLLLAMEDESQWAIKNGLIGQTKMPNYLEFIYSDGLESVKPKAVRILR
jgi:sulfonate transport system substrate-binding protein